MQPLIINCSVTGSTITPSMNPNLPWSHAQIIESALDAAEAGASTLHLHTRKDADGRPSWEIEDYRAILSPIKAGTDAPIGTTAVLSAAATPEQRAAHIVELAPEMAAVLPGSVNYSLHNRVSMVKEWRFDWEKPYLENSSNGYAKSTFADLEEQLRLHKEHNVKPSFEAFGASQVRNIAFLVAEGLVEKPVHIELVLGALGGIGDDVEDLVYLVNRAEKYFGADGFTWGVCCLSGLGRLTPIPAAIQMGGHVRVGLEDVINIRPGEVAKSNRQLVEMIKTLAAELGREVATPQQAREILGLKGSDKVKF